MSATALDRGDIIVGLRELVAELRDAGEVAGIRLVGGAGRNLTREHLTSWTRRSRFRSARVRG